MSTVQPFITLQPAASVFRDKDVGIRTVVGVTCALSIMGSILIILSYLFQTKRTKSREILAHISVMDFGVAMSNLVGLSVYFDRFYRASDGASAYIDRLCKAQSFFAMYCTLGSVYWTTALAGYLYITIVYRKHPRYSLHFLRFCYFLCYGLAFGISLWLILTKRLGFAPFDSAGWCSLIVEDPITRKVNLFVSIFAYDIWIYLAIILIILFYVAIKSYISHELQSSAEGEDWEASKKFVDYKFILIPVIFVLLRMWTEITTIIVEYAKVDGQSHHELSILLKILIYLGGIGDSGQGITNAILFVFLSKSARKVFMDVVCCKRCRKEGQGTTGSTSILKEKSHETGDFPPLYGSNNQEVSINIDAVNC